MSNIFHGFTKFNHQSSMFNMKSLKSWKTIIQFIITVLTAVVSSFLTQSCMAA